MLQDILDGKEMNEVFVTIVHDTNPNYEIKNILLIDNVCSRIASTTYQTN